MMGAVPRYITAGFILEEGLPLSLLKRIVDSMELYNKMPMRRSTRRLMILLASLPVAVFMFGLIYMLGMHYLEGAPHSLGHSLEWSAETLTTTGYGADNQWHNPVMTLFVIITQFVGLFLIFLIFPVYVLPYFEERFESRLPRTLSGISNHVLIYRFGPAVESLIEELRRFGCDTLVIEEDEAVARALHERGQKVVAAQLDGGDIDFGLMAGCTGHSGQWQGSR